MGTFNHQSSPCPAPPWPGMRRTGMTGQSDIWSPLPHLPIAWGGAKGDRMLPNVTGCYWMLLSSCDSCDSCAALGHIGTCQNRVILSLWLALKHRRTNRTVCCGHPPIFLRPAAFPSWQLRTTFKDTVIPLEGTEGAKMSRLAQFHFLTFFWIVAPDSWTPRKGGWGKSCLLVTDACFMAAVWNPCIPCPFGFWRQVSSEWRLEETAPWRWRAASRNPFSSWRLTWKLGPSHGWQKHWAGWGHRLVVTMVTPFCVKRAGWTVPQPKHVGETHKQKGTRCRQTYHLPAGLSGLEVGTAHWVSWQLAVVVDRPAMATTGNWEGFKHSPGKGNPFWKPKAKSRHACYGSMKMLELVETQKTTSFKFEFGLPKTWDGAWLFPSLSSTEIVRNPSFHFLPWLRVCCCRSLTSPLRSRVNTSSKWSSAIDFPRSMDFLHCWTMGLIYIAKTRDETIYILIPYIYIYNYI